MNGPSALSGGAQHQLELPRDPMDAELVVLAAFRYALGRQTYLVPAIARWLRRVLSGLSSHLQELIAREIDAAESLKDLGDEYDAAEWRAVRQDVRSTIGPSAQSGSTSCAVKPPAQKRRGAERRTARTAKPVRPADNC